MREMKHIYKSEINSHYVFLQKCHGSHEKDGNQTIHYNMDDMFHLKQENL